MTLVGRGTALAVSLVIISACTGSASKIDLTPLPTAYGPPFICGHVPKVAVERMTGVTDPLTTGSVELAGADPLRPATGACSAYERSGERWTVLRIFQDVGGSRGQIENQLRDGVSKQLPEIVPGGFGFSTTDPNDEKRAGATLVKGKARLSIELVKGAEGRDNAADVVALMKLIAPELVPTSSTGEDG